MCSEHDSLCNDISYIDFFVRQVEPNAKCCSALCVSLLQTVCIRMAQLLDGAGKLGWVLLKAVLRFVFMFFNNCVAIPSYCLYLLLLQPLRIWDSSTFWHIEGIMFKWLLAMVSSWGWIAGYTGKILVSNSVL